MGDPQREAKAILTAPGQKLYTFQTPEGLSEEHLEDAARRFSQFGATGQRKQMARWLNKDYARRSLIVTHPDMIQMFKAIALLPVRIYEAGRYFFPKYYLAERAFVIATGFEPILGTSANRKEELANAVLYLGILKGTEWLLKSGAVAYESLLARRAAGKSKAPPAGYIKVVDKGKGEKKKLRAHKRRMKANGKPTNKKGHPKANKQANGGRNANFLGTQREIYVARLVRGRTYNQQVYAKPGGSPNNPYIEVDILGPRGEFIQVGGSAKGWSKGASKDAKKLAWDKTIGQLGRNARVARAHNREPWVALERRTSKDLIEKIRRHKTDGKPTVTRIIYFDDSAIMPAMLSTGISSSVRPSAVSAAVRPTAASAAGAFEGRRRERYRPRRL